MEFVGLGGFKMSEIKNEHKKYGKAILFSLLIENKIEDLCEEYKIKPTNGKKLNFHEKIDRLYKSKVVIKSMFEKEYGSGNELKLKKYNKKLDKYEEKMHERYDELKKWRKKRNELVHDDYIAFSNNEEFKVFLNECKELVDFFDIETIKEYNDAKLVAIGKLVYMSTFVEKHIDEKCENRNINIYDEARKRKPFYVKVDEILMTKHKKTKKYEDMKVWWSKRSIILHSLSELQTTSTTDIESFINEINEWLNIEL